MDPLSPWDYELPEERIARYPAERRDGSRLMHLPLLGQEVLHRRFEELPELLRAGDLLVVNDTRVMAARLRAHRRTGGAVELLLLEPGPGPILAMVRPLRRLKEGEDLLLGDGHTARLLSRAPDGLVRVALSADPVEIMARQGELPLPPYLDRAAEPSDDERYQTVYAGPLGAAAAPTAGLHFTPALLEQLEGQGIGLARVTLHVGIATFRPLRPVDLDRGELHREVYEVPEDTVAAIARTRAGGGRVISVGTTTARTLESTTPEGAAAPTPGRGSTRIFIRPPYRFRGMDGLITNFHLPRSSLLMMVASLVGRQRLLAAYGEALRAGYRFYSYGDAMLLL